MFWFVGTGALGVSIFVLSCLNVIRTLLIIIFCLNFEIFTRICLFL